MASLRSNRTIRHKLTAACGLFLICSAFGNASSAGADDKPSFTKQQLVEKLKHSTCWVLGKRKNSKTYTPSGTGWVIDTKEKLVITNHHVINGYESLAVYFPMKQAGEWVNDKATYLKLKPIKASVIDFADQKKDVDLALLKLESLPKDAVEIPLAKKSAPQGAQLHSLGASTLASSALWTYTFGHVRLISKTKLGPGGRTAKVMEAQMETNKGNSGGPVVNDHLELVAVVRAHWNQFGGHRVRNVSLYVDVTEVASFTKKAKALMNPQTADDFFRRGTRRYDLGKYTDSIRDFSKAIAKNPKLTDAYIKRGLAFMQNGDYRTALSDIDDVIKKNGGHAEAYFARSLINRKLKKPTEELADLTNAIRTKPGDWKYYYYRGRYYYAKRKYSDALNDFTQAKKNDATEYFPKFYYADSLQKLKRYKEAVPAFQIALKLNPSHATAHNNLGVAYFNLKQYREAAGKFQDAIKYNSRFSVYHGNLGLTYINLRQYRSAISSLDRAISIFKQAHYYSNRGRAKHYLSKYDDAIKDFTLAIGLDKKNADYYYYRGRSYAAKKFKFSAKSDYERAAALNKTRYGFLLKKKPATKKP